MGMDAAQIVLLKLDGHALWENVQELHCLSDTSTVSHLMEATKIRL